MHAAANPVAIAYIAGAWAMWMPTRCTVATTSVVARSPKACSNAVQCRLVDLWAGRRSRAVHNPTGLEYDIVGLRSSSTRIDEGPPGIVNVLAPVVVVDGDGRRYVLPLRRDSRSANGW